MANFTINRKKFLKLINYLNIQRILFVTYLGHEKEFLVITHFVQVNLSFWTYPKERFI